MLSLLRIAAAPVTLKLSPPSHQCSPYSPLNKRATFTQILVDASNSSAGTQVAIRHLDEANKWTTVTERPPLTLLPPAFDDDDCKGEHDAAITSAISPSEPASDDGSSVFPVHGPFDLVHCLQTGGFGSAWAARDRSTGRLLCLKVFQSVQSPNVRRSVRTELNAFKRLVKSNKGGRGKQFIMELNRSMQFGTDVFFAMELMATDLGSYFCLEPERCTLLARRWMAQIALGIQSLHEMGIIHRDIKTENILIDPRENIRIIDFGLAHLGRAGKPPRALDFLGTPPYMAPEVLRNKRASTYQRTYYGVAIDWWGLGCILFELESQDHQLPFDNEDDVVAYVTWTRKLVKLEERYPRFDGLDPVVVDLLEGLLEVIPSHRYGLNDMEKHAYFLRRDGTSEFDNAAARALERPVLPELVPGFDGNLQPIKVVDAAKLATSNDWTNLKWALTDMVKNMDETVVHD